jgi:hypothetical protein
VCSLFDEGRLGDSKGAISTVSCAAIVGKQKRRRPVDEADVVAIKVRRAWAYCDVGCLGLNQLQDQRRPHEAVDKGVHGVSDRAVEMEPRHKSNGAWLTCYTSRYRYGALARAAPRPGKWAALMREHDASMSSASPSARR